MKDISGFVYLALGDPMQKRNYYRAGWIKFTEDADMEKGLTSLGEKKVGQSNSKFVNIAESAFRVDRRVQASRQPLHETIR